MATEKFYITIVLDRYGNDQLSWVSMLKDIYLIHGKPFETWTTDLNKAKVMNYATAVEYFTILKKEYPRSKLNIQSVEII